MPGVEVRHTLEVVGEVRRSQAVEAAVDKNCQFVVDPLSRSGCHTRRHIRSKSE